MKPLYLLFVCWICAAALNTALAFFQASVSASIPHPKHLFGPWGSLGLAVLNLSLAAMHVPYMGKKAAK